VNEMKSEIGAARLGIYYFSFIVGINALDINCRAQSRFRAIPARERERSGRCVCVRAWAAGGGEESE
jgi:hypothetical protein